MTYPENPPYTGGPDEVVPTGGLSATGIAALAAISAQDWEDELYGAADTFLTPISELLGKLFDLFAEFVDLDGFIEIASDVLGFFYNILDRAGFFDLLSGGVDFFGWLVELGADAIETLIKPIVEFLQWVWELIGPTLQGLIEQVINFLSPFLSPQQFVDILNAIFDYFSKLADGVDTVGDIVEALFSKIPILGPLVSKLTGRDSSGDNELDLTALGEWARTLENDVTVGVGKLTAAAERLLNGRLPVGQISDTPVNILLQGDFLTSSTVEEKDGWSWDGSQSRTGSGGSLRVTCNNTAQRIYCRQDIKVAEGDRLTLTGYVGTSPGYTSGSMRLSIQPWGPEGSPPVMTAKTVVNGTARTTSASTYQALPQLDYTVPAGVTSVQVSLVANCNTGCNVYFDDIRLTKTGVLPQGLVTNLLDAINGILLGAGYTFGTGWQFLQTAVSGVAQDASNALTGNEDTNLVLFGDLGIPENDPLGVLAGQLGTPLLSGSGARMIRTDTANKVTAQTGNRKFTNFYTVNSASADITASASNGSFQVTHAGYYLVEVGFNANSSPPGAGAFSVAPAVYVGGSSTPYKVGGDAMGSYGTIGDATFGNWARSAQSSFIVYLPATGVVQAGYVNRQGEVSSFFQGDPDGANCYFSIAMLNRTDEG